MSPACPQQHQRHLIDGVRLFGPLPCAFGAGGGTALFGFGLRFPMDTRYGWTLQYLRTAHDLWPYGMHTITAQQLYSSSLYSSAALYITPLLPVIS